MAISNVMNPRFHSFFVKNLQSLERRLLLPNLKRGADFYYELDIKPQIA